MALKSPLKKPSHFRVDQADLLCKNKCGYFGNTSWKGYCSKCYREVYQKSSKYKAEKGPEFIHRSAPPNQQSFSKFEEKKKQQEKGVASVRSLLKKPSATGTRESSSLKDALQLALAPADVQTFGSDFATCLRDLDPQLADGLRSKVSAVMAKLRELTPLTAVEDWSDAVQDFYQDVADLLSRGSQSTGLTEDAEQKVMDCVENCLTQTIYSFVFCPASDEDADLKLHKRIRSLHWVTDKQLEADLASEHDLGVRATLELAMTEIIQMDARRSPKEKLQCIVDCSRAIFTALHKSRLVSSIQSASAEGATDKLDTAAGGAAMPAASSADDFLPAFIYIVLKANPPRLQSNMSYVTRFANPSRLNRGEGGYFFTNLCCVVDFIRKLNAESLNLSEDEFEAYMSGERTPEGASGVGGVCASLYMCDGLRLLHENLLLLEELRQRETRLEEATATYELRAADSIRELNAAVDSLLQDTCPLAPQRQPWRRRKVDPDADLIECPPTLPAPMLPQMVTGYRQLHTNLQEGACQGQSEVLLEDQEHFAVPREDQGHSAVRRQEGLGHAKGLLEQTLPELDAARAERVEQSSSGTPPEGLPNNESIETNVTDVPRQKEVAAVAETEQEQSKARLEMATGSEQPQQQRSAPGVLPAGLAAMSDLWEAALDTMEAEESAAAAIATAELASGSAVAIYSATAAVPESAAGEAISESTAGEAMSEPAVGEAMSEFVAGEAMSEPTAAEALPGPATGVDVPESATVCEPESAAVGAPGSVTATGGALSQSATGEGAAESAATAGQGVREPTVAATLDLAAPGSAASPTDEAADELAGITTQSATNPLDPEQVAATTWCLSNDADSSHETAATGSSGSVVAAAEVQ